MLIKLFCLPCHKYFILSGLVLFGSIGSISAQTYYGRTQAGGNVDETLAVTGDATGNTFATGYFSTAASISGINLSSSGLTDIFVTRINANGNAAWSVRAGGTSSDRGLGIATDPQGNVLVCGFFTGTASFGNGISLTANGGSQDAFVAKYNAQGNALWARAGGSTGNSDRANAVATDAQGNVFITGQFTGEAAFGTFNLNGTGASNDVFVMKYSPEGNELWAKSGSGTALNRGLGITTDNSGAVYACGQFSGNINFDNAYTNTIQNALFVVKYGSSGSEEWMRFAGGSEQSIAYDITSNGTNVYLTGDCGQTLTWVNAPGSPSITTGSQNAVYIAALNPSGGFLWGSSKGSSSPVSGRGISHHNGQLGVAGWFECTYDGLSEEYGEATFNNIGFRDVFVMRYNTAGSFLWARNFGSQTSEVASGIHILPDNLDVVCGTFTGDMTFAIRHAVAGNGLAALNTPLPIPVTNYCGDSNYHQYARITGNASDDGFLVKAIDTEREPYDYYRRYGSGCDRSIPEPCIHIAAGQGWPAVCPESLIGCPGYVVAATNYANHGVSAIGYAFNVQWSTGASSITTPVNGPGTMSVTFTSLDGCYSVTTSTVVDVHPPVDKPTMTDSQGVNNDALVTQTIFLCPGEEVDLTANSPHPGVWAGPGITAGSANQPTVTVNQTGAFQYLVTSPEGCTAFNFVQVIVLPVPEPIDPIITFNTSTDSLAICGGTSAMATVIDNFTGAPVSPAGYSWSWTVTPSGTASGNNPHSATNLTASGWYHFSVVIEANENECLEDTIIYTLSDSVYVVLNPLPEVFLNVTPPPLAICPGDTLWAYVETNAAAIGVGGTATTVSFGDSIMVLGPGSVQITATVTNEFDCFATANGSFSISSVATPTIEANIEPAVVCPGDSILLTTDAIGDYVWQGPSGSQLGGANIYVYEPGLYFVEVEFYDGCSLVSNTLQVSEYATPFLNSADVVLCPDSSAQLVINTNPGANITWLPPLDGATGTTQTVSSPGEYSVIVESCGIQTQLSIFVFQSPSVLAIAQTDLSPVCEGDSIGLVASSGFENYEWFGATGSGIEAWMYANGLAQANAIDSLGCPVSSNVLNVQFEPIPLAPQFEFVLPCIGDLLQVNAISPFSVDWLSGPDGDVIFQGGSITIASFTIDTTFYALASTEWCTGPVASIELSPKPRPEAPIPTTDAPVCTGTVFTLEVLNNEPGVAYYWLKEGVIVASGASANVSATSIQIAGLYTVYGLLDGCPGDTTSIEVDLIETVQVQLPPDTAVCVQSQYSIGTQVPFAAYLWQDGSSDSIYTAQSSGIFALIATDFNGCLSQAQVELELVDCAVQIPNIFTPNGDGFNDLWVISVAQPLTFRITVYNRWGRIVYESDVVGKWWDGNHYQNGEPCSEGVYFYIADITSFENVPYSLTGNITLLRERR